MDPVSFSSDGYPLDESLDSDTNVDAAVGRNPIGWRSFVDQLHRVQTANADQLDPIATLHLVANTAASLFGAALAELYITDVETATVRRLVGVGDAEGPRVPGDIKRFATEVAVADPISSVDGRSDPLRAMLAVPLLRQRRSIGSLVLAWPGAMPTVDALELRMLKMLATSATVALNRARSEATTDVGAGEGLAEVGSLAEFDALTGLVNRAAAKSLLDRWEAPNPPAVIAIDLDRFRVINEAHGMRVGDEVLRGVAERLVSATRADDLVARVAGDEFLLVIEALSEAQVREVAARVQSALSVPIVVRGAPVRLLASIGAAIAHAGDPSEIVLLNADLARAHAKRRGGDQVVHFDEALRAESIATATLERELVGAIENDEFEVWFQPLVHIATRQLIGAEALVRWRHRTRGLLEPGAFLPIAEATGQIARIDQLVMTAALGQIRQWDLEGLLHARFRVSVNVSADRFVDPQFLASIREGTAEGIAHRLRVELTETVVMGDGGLAVEVMRSLCDLGVTISLDDFGTGWSSLAYLKRFPVDSLKVDREFVTDIVEDSDGRAIVEIIVRLAEALELGLLAEGIETEAQERVLTELGCRYGQGYLYDRPLPAEEFERRWLQSEPAQRDRAEADRDQ